MVAIRVRVPKYHVTGRPRCSRTERRTFTCPNCQEYHTWQRLELVDIPFLHCTACKRKNPQDFDFCFGEMTVNNHKFIGDPMYQGETCLCEFFCFAKIMEITKKLQYLMRGKDPTVIGQMDPFDLNIACTAARTEEDRQQNDPNALPNLINLLLGKKQDGEENIGNGLRQTVMLTRLLQRRGIKDLMRTKLFKASNISVICKDDHAAIVRALGNGFPLQASVVHGWKFRSHRYCRPYKPMFLQKMLKIRKEGPVHGVVLVGAVKKKGRLSYYCMNSWKQFCVRRSTKGALLRHGIGKVDATRLFRNVIRVSRFKEPSTVTSLKPENTYHENVNLLHGKFIEETVKPF